MNKARSYREWLKILADFSQKEAWEEYHERLKDEKPLRPVSLLHHECEL